MTTILHIGLPKTGTTFCQNMLLSLKEQLLDPNQLELSQIPYEDIWGVIRDDINSQASPGRDIIDTFYHHERISEKAKSKFSTLLYEDLKNRKHSVLFSQENFSYLAVSNKYFSDSPSLLFIINEFKKYGPLKIILTIRRQDEFLESMYMQHVRSGSILNFNEYFEKFPTANLNWLRLIEKLESLIGRENLVIIPYENEVIRSGGYADIFQLFLKAIDTRLNVQPTGKLILVAPSLDPKHVSTAIENNKKLSLQEARDAYIELSLKFTKMPNQPFDLLTPEQRSKVLFEHQSGNRDIFKKYLAAYKGDYYIYF